ncbi:MAG: iron export ABC transporter permease subunit FetB [Deltaproteobacteria bacterium]|nr:iron export ABC transporter permease subunit FetB [Deltaproteobacteria bacterium]
MPLDAVDLAIASGLVVIAGLTSLALGTGLVGRLAVASVRTVLQLLLVGYVLEWVFGLDSAPAVMACLAFMLVVAGRTAVRRAERTFRGATWRAILTLTLTGLSTALTVTALVIRVEPWWDPQYLLPIIGMVLGNTLTGLSLSIDKLLEDLSERAALIESDLALGATRWEAGRDAVTGAVRRGMIPILNAMTVAGLVSLPGMMTGQILAGQRPLDAVLYQIVVMFMLAAASAMGATGVALFTWHRLFDARHQLRSERIRRR